MLNTALFFRPRFFSSRRMEIMREEEEEKEEAAAVVVVVVGGAKSRTLNQRPKLCKDKSKRCGSVISAKADAARSMLRALPPCFDDVMCSQNRCSNCQEIVT